MAGYWPLLGCIFGVSVFGISLDEAIVILALMALIVGPKRLPLLVSRLTERIRHMKVLWRAANDRADADAVALWASSGINSFDPRYLVQSDLVEDDAQSFVALPPPVPALPEDASTSSEQGIGNVA